MNDVECVLAGPQGYVDFLYGKGPKQIPSSKLREAIMLFKSGEVKFMAKDNNPPRPSPSSNEQGD